ncbi:MAG: hypothetical protein M3Q97_03030 [Bacteroidota bacterium]|nr:hypothetical protein [Bacteroidota bacterium]
MKRLILFFVLLTSSLTLPAQRITTYVSPVDYKNYVMYRFEQINRAIYAAVYNGRVTAYADNGFGEAYSKENLRSLGSHEEIVSVYLDPNDPYAYTDTLIVSPLDPMHISSLKFSSPNFTNPATSIEVFYSSYGNIPENTLYFLRSKDIVGNLAPDDVKLLQFFFQWSEQLNEPQKHWTVDRETLLQFAEAAFSSTSIQLYLSVKNGATAYRNDSLASHYSQEDALKMGSMMEMMQLQNEEGEFSVDTLVFTPFDYTTIAGIAVAEDLVASRTKYTGTITALAPMYNHYLGGIQLPKMPMFYIKYPETAKAIRQADMELLLTVIHFSRLAKNAPNRYNSRWYEEYSEEADY